MLAFKLFSLTVLHAILLLFFASHGSYSFNVKPISFIMTKYHQRNSIHLLRMNSNDKFLRPSVMKWLSNAKKAVKKQAANILTTLSLAVLIAMPGAASASRGRSNARDTITSKVRLLSSTATVDSVLGKIECELFIFNRK